MKKILTILIILSLIGGVYLYKINTAKAAWLSGWDYRVKVTVLATKVDADLTDYPVYVNLNNLPAGFHANVNQTDARDIRVTTDDGETEVPREVVFYTAATDTGELHFKGNVLNETNVDFYIYYGNAGASDYAVDAEFGAENVWTSSYQAVYHFQTDPSSTVLDSTTNDYDLAGSNMGSANLTTGKLSGYGYDFNGSDEQLKDTDQVWADANNSITVSFWSNFASADTAQNATIFRYTTNVNERNSAHAPWSSTDYWDFGTCCSAPGRISGLNTSYDDKYSKFDLTGGANHEIYIDGVSRYAAGSSDAPTGALTGLAIGSGIDAEYHNGVIDEFRIATVERSSTWISTENNNQSDPDTFFTIGGAEVGETALRISIKGGSLIIKGHRVEIK